MTEWAYGKSKRKVDKELLAKIKTQPCAICGSLKDIDPAHIKSRGSGGPDEDWNLVALCRFDHIRQHASGFVKLYEKHESFRLALQAKGWFVSNGRLKR